MLACCQWPYYPLRLAAISELVQRSRLKAYLLLHDPTHVEIPIADSSTMTRCGRERDRHKPINHMIKPYCAAHLRMAMA
jgi:hypothetical protein